MPLAFSADPNTRRSAARGFMLTILSLMLCTTVFGQHSQEPATEEIIITGKVSGPPLWQVKNGANTLWIFGFLSPLPEDFEFDSSGLEEVIAGADEMLSRPDDGVLAQLQAKGEVIAP